MNPPLPRMSASVARALKHRRCHRRAVHSFPTGDEGGITGPNEGGITVDECGAAVTAGHFNPLFVTPDLPQGQAQTLYEIGDFTGKFGLLAAVAATVEPAPAPALPPSSPAQVLRLAGPRRRTMWLAPTPLAPHPAPFSPPSQHPFTPLSRSPKPLRSGRIDMRMPSRRST